MRHAVALGLADALLAGPASVRSATMRCARVLGSRSSWLAPLVHSMVRSFGAAWHAGSRRDLAVAILRSPQFHAAWSDTHPPRLRSLFLQPPRMAPPQAQLRECALPDLPTVGDIADWLELQPRELEWFAGIRRRQTAADNERLWHYSYRWVEKRSGGHRLLEIPKFPVHHSSFIVHRYLMASGFTGDPTAPVIGSAGATNRNS